MYLDEIHQFIQSHDNDPAHSIHVGRLSLLLFDQLEKLHQCDEKARMLLQCAAYLHDIGLTISHKKHHIHSSIIIKNGNFPSFTPKEKLLIGNIARYHRKSFPCIKHNEYAVLTPTEQQIVRKMSALLRIADALDYTRTSSIKNLVCSIEGYHCNCFLFPHASCFKIKSAVTHKKDLFFDVFKLDFVIHEPRNEIKNSTHDEASIPVVTTATNS